MQPWTPTALCDASRWRALFVGLGLLLPTLALSGYVTAGNQVLRAATNPDYTRLLLHFSDSDSLGRIRAALS